MKSIPNQPGLFRTQERYHFRKRIPKDIQATLGVLECKRSFKKADYRAAKRTTAFLNSALEALFDTIRVMQPTSDDIKAIIRMYFERLLMEAEADLYLDTEAWRGLVNDYHDGATADDRIAQFEEELTQVRAIARQQGQKERFWEIAKGLLEHKGLTFNEMSPTSHHLFNGLMDAEIEARRIELAIRKGESENGVIRNPMLADCRNYMVDPDIDLQIQNWGLPYYNKPSETQLLSEVIREHIGFVGRKKYAGGTLKDREQALMLMVEIWGPEKRLGAVSPVDIRGLRNVINTMPSNYTKKFKAKGVSLLDAIKNPDSYEPLSPRSQDKYWQWISAFFQWCMAEAYIPANPVGEIKISPAKPSIKDRDMFLDNELEALFRSPQYSGHKSQARRAEPGSEIIKDGKYWLPLIALFTGMRCGEILSLQLRDIRLENDIPYLDINKDEDFKSQKTEQSARIIPIHPELVKMGFLKMVDAKRLKYPESERLFSDITVSEKRGISHEFSKYFARYLERIDIKHKKLTFHSFRHNFSQALRDNRVDIERRDALEGRRTGFKAGSDTRRNYGRAFTASDLYPELCAVKYNVDLSHLYQS